MNEIEKDRGLLKRDKRKRKRVELKEEEDILEENKKNEEKQQKKMKNIEKNLENLVEIRTGAILKNHIFEKRSIDGIWGSTIKLP